MSSPPHRDGYNPSGPQARSDREVPSPEDYKYKRRRIEFQRSARRHMAEYSPIPPRNSVPTSVPSSRDLLATSLQETPRLMQPGVFMEEDAALEYLASGSGFAQDLRGVDPPFAYQNLAPTGQHQRPVNMSSFVYQPALSPDLEFALVRPLEESIFHHHRESDERLREPPGHSVESSTSLTANSFGYPVDWPQSAAFPPRPVATTSVSSGQGPPSSATDSQKPPIMLILTRATTEDIEALESHKKECPACQLEFEKDHFMAVITCCNTPIHATCLSAWVNSVTYSKSKACMKCRRTIDARRMLNNVVPPVTDKSWDEGVEFKAPESLKGDAKIELNVSAKPERSRMRRVGGSMYYANYRSARSFLALPEALSPETRSAVLQLREERIRQSDELRNQSRVASSDCNRANHEDIAANSALLEAQLRGELADLTPLIRRCEKTKLAREKARETYDKVKLALDTMDRTYQHRLNSMFDERTERYRASRRAEDEPARSAPFRVVNGEPSDEISP
ncbi:hypothetical protein AYO21_06829 [Fonsecaea monophora]|uniref:RING-type domain-containing protein n=1 Tax=Fonsecaea monophora TaxID=254056 RepID=A0A177F5L2_9EURO|nr:hypothetical protein AYO21_06829 [Fonsecaea monophora]OAG38951.1 hypothetical protein AYO21_06829 [Fonsecaea monophora]